VASPAGEKFDTPSPEAKEWCVIVEPPNPEAEKRRRKNTGRTSRHRRPRYLSIKRHFHTTQDQIRTKKENMRLNIVIFPM